MRASEPGRLGLASCHASSMVISLAKRVFSVDFGGALPAVIRVEVVADEAESIDLVVMLARRAEPSRRSSAADALSLMDASRMLPNAKIVHSPRSTTRVVPASAIARVICRRPCSVSPLQRRSGGRLH